MNQYPQSPDITQQPPNYVHDPNQQQQYQQQGQPMYAQPQQPQYTGSPVPQQPQGAYAAPQQPGFEHQQAAYPDQTKGAHPGMPPQAQSGTVYQNATPIASLNRGPAPADCPACGQRAMTNVAFETGNTTQ
jgi:lipopolysaccharide-induced tumor necrosis factor-alpha factor